MLATILEASKKDEELGKMLELVREYAEIYLLAKSVRRAVMAWARWQHSRRV